MADEPGSTAGKSTQLSFEVADIDQVVADLRARRLRFETIIIISRQSGSTHRPEDWPATHLLPRCARRHRTAGPDQISASRPGWRRRAKWRRMRSRS